MRARSDLVQDSISDILYVKDNVIFYHKTDYCGYKKGYLMKALNEIEMELIICPDCSGIMKRASINDGVTKCEVCTNRDFTVKPPEPVKHIRNVIGKLKISCPLLRKCDWKGKMSEAEDHLSKCNYFLLECSLKCRKVLPRGDLPEHIKRDCPLRKVLCIFCNDNSIYAMNLTNHLKICPKYLVRCSLCTDVMARCELRDHQNSTCEMFILNCLHEKEGCKERIERMNLEEHVHDKCLWRKVTCKFCKIDTIFAKDLTKHHETCPKYIIKCPLCPEEMERCQVTNHHNTTCQLFVLDCPFKKYGCEEKIKRKDIVAHKKEFYIEHQNLIVADLEGFKEDNSQKLENMKEKMQEEKIQHQHELSDTRVEIEKKNVRIQEGLLCDLNQLRDEMKLMKRLYKIEWNIWNIGSLAHGVEVQGPVFSLDDNKCQCCLKTRKVGDNMCIDLFLLRVDSDSNSESSLYITECRLVIKHQNPNLDHFNSISLKYRINAKETGCRESFFTLTQNVYSKFITEEKNYFRIARIEKCLTLILHLDYKNTLVPGLFK